jgi:hypothetical protein
MLIHDISVGIVTGYELKSRDLIPGRGKRFFFTPQCSYRFWGPPNLLSDGYQGLFPRGYSGQGVKLTTHLSLVPRSRMVELYLQTPIS